MIEKEYLTVKELSKKYLLCPRQIRKTIQKLKLDTTSDLIRKDTHTGIWMVHHILSSRFKPTRIHKQDYYALTLDVPSNFSESDIQQVMRFVIDRMEGPNVEINYTIEKKKATGENHLHCYINCKQRKKLIESIRLGFSDVSYKEAEIFDLSGWVNYITKDGNKIITIKKQ